jgi:hypothetical protein
MQSRSTQAGGCLLVVAILGGVFLGVIFDQPTIGTLIGIATGIAIATVFWLIDRRRG